MQIIPLVQTFGHLEWVLKLKEFKHLRDSIRFPQVRKNSENQEITKLKVICFAEPEGWNLIRDMIVQVEIIIFYLINTKCFIFKS